MVSQKITITNVHGFHLRPAGIFAAAMAKYQSKVVIKFNGNEINAKSLMSIIAACIKCGSMIDIVCTGNDEESALDEAVSIIENCMDDE